MENEKIKQYLIEFVEKTLNQSDLFSRIYGKDFARQRLENNLKQVCTGVYSETASGWYDFFEKSITLCSDNKKAKPVTIGQIKRNREKKQLILHESVHAIFARTEEECEEHGIALGTGMVEEYHDGLEIGRALNEGLTEWICEKVGYESQSYEKEVNAIKLLELALGEDVVIQFANGDIRGNIAQLLQMSEEECIQMLSTIDHISIQGNRISSLEQIVEVLEKNRNKLNAKGKEDKLKAKLGGLYDDYLEMITELGCQDEKDINIQIESLRQRREQEKNAMDRNIADFETEIFEKYLKKEIEEAQNSQTISREKMIRLNQLYKSIHGGQTIYSNRHDMLSLQYKDYIYEQLTFKYQPTFLEKITGNKRFKPEKTNLPVVRKENLLTRMKEQDFKQYISDMSNFSEQPTAQFASKITKKDKEKEDDEKEFE